MKPLRIRFQLPHHLCLLLISTLGCIVSAGCTQQSEADTDRGAPLVVHTGPFQQRLLLTGEIVAESAIELTVPNANIWPVPIRWLAEDGIEVKAGETVVEFDSSQILSTLDNLSSQTIEAENQLLSLRSELANGIGQARFTREQKLADFQKAEIAAAIPEDLSSRQDYERRRLELEKARLELQAAEENAAAQVRIAERKLEAQRLKVEQNREQVNRARSSIELLTLMAPKDGIVLVANNRREGRPYQAADSVFPGWTIASLPDLSTLIVEASLFDVDDGKLEPGTEVTATLDAFPDGSIPGIVREIDTIADQADSSSTRRAFKVRIDLEQTDPQRMRPGMSVKIEVKAKDSGDPQLLIPRAAVLSQGSDYLAVLRDGSRVPIELGACNPTVCVLREGLDEGAELSPGVIR